MSILNHHRVAIFEVESLGARIALLSGATAAVLMGRAGLKARPGGRFGFFRLGAFLLLKRREPQGTAGSCST